jgi:hypothetical protein
MVARSITKSVYIECETGVSEWNYYNCYLYRFTLADVVVVHSPVQSQILF